MAYPLHDNSVINHNFLFIRAAWFENASVIVIKVLLLMAAPAGVERKLKLVKPSENTLWKVKNVTTKQTVIRFLFFVQPHVKKKKKSFNSQFVSCNPGKKLQFFLRWRPSSFHPHIVCYRKLVSQTSLVVERNGPETKRNLDLEEKTGRGKVWGQVLTFEPLILHRLSLITHWITCLVLRLLLDLCKDLSCVWVNLFNFRLLVLQLDHS